MRVQVGAKEWFLIFLCDFMQKNCRQFHAILWLVASTCGWRTCWTWTTELCFGEMRSQKITPPPSDPPHCTKFAWIAGGESWSCLILSQMYVDANYGNVFTQAQQRFWGFFWWRWRYVMFFQPFRSITPMWSWWMRAHDGRKPLERRWILVDGTSCFHCGVWTLAGGYARSSWKICTSAKRKLLIGMGWGLTRNVWVTSQFLMAF